MQIVSAEQDWGGGGKQVTVKKKRRDLVKFPIFD